MSEVRVSKTALQQAAASRPDGYLEEVLSLATGDDGEYVFLSELDYRKLRDKYSPPPPPGAGTQLKSLLKEWLGFESSPTCRCNSMAAKMDMLGPDWCESDAGMSEILEVMKTEHRKRRSSNQTILPWSDFGAKQLVLLACRRAKNALTTDTTG